MLAISFRFPAGRYHATPWGRHVNEAEVEWPPSPWRILRALIATWHRKADTERYPQPLLDELVESLAEHLPVYQLPPAVRTHSRHYMPQGRLAKAGEDRSLIFDGFARLSRDAELTVGWPGLDLRAEQLELLGALVRDIGYLGRAESWVEGRVFQDWDGDANCRASLKSVDTATGEIFEPLRLAAPISATDYSTWREQMIAEHDLGGKLNAKKKLLLTTLPESLSAAARLDTAAIHRAGWNRPPGMRFVTYQRPYEVFKPPVRLRIGTPSAPVTTVRLALAGRPRPRIEDAVRIAELVRDAALRSATALGEDVPAALSGLGAPGRSQHGHAFYLPEPARDGRIDHVLVHALDGLDHLALRALDRIRRIETEDSVELGVMLEHCGLPEDFAGIAYLARSRAWQSTTPYLHPWYQKKRFSVGDQIRRECRLRGHPEPEIEQASTIRIRGRERRPVHFRRFRTRRGLSQPDTQGSFWRLTFPEPIDGPLALGFGCHFGLGCFQPASVRHHDPPKGFSP